MGWVVEKQPPPAPVPPQDLVYLWNDFALLDAQRDSGVNGRCRIKCTEIESYERLMGVHHDPWEVEAIWALDDIRVNLPPPGVKQAPEGPEEGQDG